VSKQQYIQVSRSERNLGRVISYRCSVGTGSLSPRDFEILMFKCIWVTVLTSLETTSCDHSFTHGPFPIGVPLGLTLSISNNTVLELDACISDYSVQVIQLMLYLHNSSPSY